MILKVADKISLSKRDVFCFLVRADIKQKVAVREVLFLLCFCPNGGGKRKTTSCLPSIETRGKNRFRDDGDIDSWLNARLGHGYTRRCNDLYVSSDVFSRAQCRRFLCFLLVGDKSREETRK